jgi:hypothetical protein
MTRRSCIWPLLQTRHFQCSVVDPPHTPTAPRMTAELAGETSQRTTLRSLTLPSVVVVNEFPSAAALAPLVALGRRGGGNAPFAPLGDLDPGACLGLGIPPVLGAVAHGHLAVAALAEPHLAARAAGADEVGDIARGRPNQRDYRQLPSTMFFASATLPSRVSTEMH